ncbi:MAG: anhydro-N-acetylmuramic acid kinase [Alphaproteobacteria bacterium]|nr:anhydro-N-acetylmuramic acid kinase [Alphaproteobacteria bacterium]
MTAKSHWALGLMSGTSLDGIDLALIETDGERVVGFGPWRTVPYTAAERERVRSALGGRESTAQAAEVVTRSHAAAVELFLNEDEISPYEIDVIGFHGHTILHRPAERVTVQIGDGAALAAAVGIDVVGDFRSADVQAGGQGAPLAPLYHAALAAALPRPVAVLNIGGVANVTWIGRDDRLMAFDSGPGNALLDDWVRAHTGAAYDRDGATARSGRVDEVRLAALMSHPFFEKYPPKSLDRNDFASSILDEMEVADGLATLVAFTVAAIAGARRFFPEPAVRWLVCGGGRHNGAVLDALRRALVVSVEPVEAVGWRGDALEAEAFAFLAVRSRRGLPLSLPETTGVPRPLAGGTLFPAPVRWQSAPWPAGSP